MDGEHNGKINRIICNAFLIFRAKLKRAKNKNKNKIKDGRIEQDGKKGIAVMPGVARKGKTKLNLERRM